MNRDWKTINEKIKNCRRRGSPTEIISSLERLYNMEGDGMVAFAIGEEYEKIHDFMKAKRYYELAESLFPLENYKNRARQAMERINVKVKYQEKETEEKNVWKEEEEEEEEEKQFEWQGDSAIQLEKYDPATTLFILACTEKKIWDILPSAPDYVPARFAYKGKNFMKSLGWIDRVGLETQGFFWIILSGKYGFIEPWHAVGEYDVNINDPLQAISEESLKNQTRQKRIWRDRNGEKTEVFLKDFKEIICLNCGSVYLDKIKTAFPLASIISTWLL